MNSERDQVTEICMHENCGSRKFHIDDDGFTYCSRGHQQSERGAVIAEDTGEVRLLGRKSRRQDSGGESSVSRASSLTRPQALEQYLVCIQFVLRKQVKWYIEQRGFSAELEVVVHDLWALRLQGLQSRTTFTSDTETEGRSSAPAISSGSEALESTSETTSRQRRGKKGLEKDGLRRGTPTLLDTLSIAYTAMLLLRAPATVADILRWTNSGDLLYYSAARQIPLAMRERLPGRYQELFEPQVLLRSEALQEQIVETLRYFKEVVGMALPPINSPLVIYHFMHDLCLPIDIFAATQRLMKLLDLDFEFQLGSHAPSYVGLRNPEVRLMAVLVTAVKMLFPFDDVKRYPFQSTDLAALRMNWSIWVREQERLKDDELVKNEDTMSFERAFQLDEAGCLKSSNDELDAYLDWYEENIASEHIREHGRAGRDADFRRTMFSLFPLKESKTTRRNADTDEQKRETTEQAIREIQHSLVEVPAIPSTPASNDRIHRLGSFYTRFREVDDLPPTAKIFFEEAARLAAVPLEGMVKSVLWVEGKLLRHEEWTRRGGQTAEVAH